MCFLDYSDNMQLKNHTRNDYIDFLRGIAAFGIISIHTAFWSGQKYIPEWFSNMTLFLDVPFFFFLSGWGSSYGKIELKKTIKSLGRIWCKWILYIIFLELVSLFLYFIGALPLTAGLADLRDFVDNAFFKVSFTGFRVVAGSIWFMPVYFVVVICFTIFITVIGVERFKADSHTYLIFMVALFLWVYFGNSFLGLDITQILFYAIFWMIGFNMFRHDQHDKYKSSCFLKNLAIIILGIITTNYLQELKLYDIQTAKFTSSPKYAFVSMLSIEVAKFFQNRIHCGKLFAFFRHIGRNAIFYFFGQGMGSSLIFLYVNAFDTDLWVLKWIGALIINIISTIIFAETLQMVYKIIVKVLNVAISVMNKDNKG